jgi:peptide-methionine (S)-S-oxide reductase
MTGAYNLRMFSFLNPSKSRMPSPTEALGGRPNPIRTAERHFVNGAALKPPYPAGTEVAEFAFGCFWGAEKDFWETPGVVVTAVGYEGGYTPNPTYDEVCSGKTGHSEAVRVVFDPSKISYDQLLKVFWEHHDPTQGMRQGNDAGTQYRSAIFIQTDAQATAANASRDMYQAELRKAGYGEITTEITAAPEFYFAEDYHQQYLAKNPHGYCPDHSTGVSCPVGLGVRAGEPATTLEQV